MIVNDIFLVTNNYTNFVIQEYDKNTNTYNDVWAGTQLDKCDYRLNTIVFMRVVGNPYDKGYIELQL